MTQSIQHIAFDLSIRQLATQKEDLRTLRSQASVVAAVSGLIATVFASFLGRSQLSAFTSDPSFLWFGIEAWFVLIAFAGSIAFCVRVVVIRRDVQFELSPSWIIERNVDRASVDDLLAEVASFAETYFDENEKVLSSVHRDLLWALLLGWLQIPAWLLLIF